MTGCLGDDWLLEIIVQIGKGSLSHMLRNKVVWIIVPVTPQNYHGHRKQQAWNLSLRR
jgi:hypothetical protein